jgi:hypothetical protein
MEEMQRESTESGGIVVLNWSGILQQTDGLICLILPVTRCKR